MPKRTNKFQRLVYVIHQQLHENALVTESKFLKNRKTGTKREVDIVIEVTNGEYKLVISVEIIAHRRKAGLEWINKMSGKHQHLPTDKLILVSASGFVKDAIKEAELNGIEIMTLTEAENSNWTVIVNKLKELFQAQLTFMPELCRVVLHTKYGQADNPVASHQLMLYNSANEALGTIEQVFKDFTSNKDVMNQIYNLENRMNISCFELNIPVPEGSYLHDTRNEPVAVSSLVITGQLKFSIEAVSLKHYQYGKAQISVGETEVNKEKMLLTVVERLGEKLSITLTSLPNE
jgi:hypothetical protein